jgi:pimeloyl-ACP methyl ester carboxylesterase
MTTAAELMVLAEGRAIKKSISVAGIDCDYWFYPAQVKNPEKAETIVLAHGYRGTHKGLESFAGGLNEFNVFAPDLPGFGTSTPLKDKHTLENYVNWFQGFIEAVGVKNPILIGHSFGTLIVSAYEAKVGNSKALVCINPVAGGTTKGLSGFLMQFVKGYYWFAHIIPESLGLRMLKTRLLVDSMSSYTTKSKDRALRLWIKGQHRDHFNSFANSDVIWESYVASITQTMQPYLDSIKKPILLVAAELDEITPVDAVKTIATRMPKAQVHVIYNCGHLVHYEAAEETVQVITKFINENS